MPSITPSQLLEIRRVKAMVAGAGTTMDPQCFLGPTGPTGATGPPGSKGNYGIPASLGYYNPSVNSQLLANATPVAVAWTFRDDNFSQGITGIEYTTSLASRVPFIAADGAFYNGSSTDSILANVCGFISFTPNASGVRAVYAEVNGTVGNIYGYTQVSAASSVDYRNLQTGSAPLNNVISSRNLYAQTASSATIVPFSFNVYLSAAKDSPTFFQIFAYQDSGNVLTINAASSRISITRINTTMMGLPGPTGPTGPSGGPTGPTGPAGATGSALLGNILRVDSVNGVDSTATIDGMPYRTVRAAIGAIGTGTGYTIWVLPGTHTMTAGLILPNGNSIRGMSVQTTTLQIINALEATTLLTMGDNTHVEDLTLRLTSVEHHTLKGVVFDGQTTRTASIRNCIVTVDNSAAPYTGSSIVTGIEAKGIGISMSSFNNIKSSIINVYSNGGGKKRGILVSGPNLISTRDVNIYVSEPTNPAADGSYVGVETADLLNTGAIQLKTTTIETVKPKLSQEFSGSDILQTNPTNQSFLTTAGIHIGPGTDLVTKTAGGKPFSTYAYSNIISYSLIGSLKNLDRVYLWPGTQAASTLLPDAPPAYYYIQKPSILAGMSCALTVPTGTDTITLTVKHTPLGTIDSTPTIFMVTFSAGVTVQNFYNASLNLGAGDRIHVYLRSTSTNLTAAGAEDLTVQLNIF